MERCGKPNGIIFHRYSHHGWYYERILQEHKDIEKDLHRGFPEYAVYQIEEGIGALHRVLLV